MITNQPVNNHDDLTKVVDGLLDEMGLNRRDTGGKMTFAGLDPLRPSVMKVGAASAAVVAASSAASAILHRQRGGKGQDIHIDLRKAYVYQSPWQAQLADCTMMNGRSVMIMPILGGLAMLPTRDNRFVMCCAPYPSQHKKLTELLHCGLVERHMAQAARKWDALDLENAAQDAALPITMVRTPAEYAASEQGKEHAKLPLVHIEKIGESAPEPLPPGSRPLSGVRVLGMTQVVAGPTVLRQLAAAGADCLNLNMPGSWEEKFIYLNSDAGIRQATVEARKPENCKEVYALVKDTDVFVENLMPHKAAQQGYGAEDFARIRPGIIYVRIKLNAVTGPWADWLGFDFNAGALTGLYTEEGTMEQPRTPVGVNVVVDFLCGIVATAGVQAALIRRAKEGGSYRITVTLAQTTMFEMSLGFNDKAKLDHIADLGPEHQIQKPNLVTGMTAWGEYTRLGSQVEMSETPESWADPILVPVGSSPPEWLPKKK
jgi:crotonobetainyl-CoA:carnitine CoA-transferase CaiB-like acyl-CoA transferase